MKIAVMQPYIFPYLGYFKLIDSVEIFVFLDDVSYINKGWVNRNRLIFSGGVNYFTLPLEGASQNNRICDLSVVSDHAWRRKLETSLRQSYSKAPFFHEVFDLVAPVLFGAETMIGEMAKHSVEVVSHYLGLRPKFIASSSVYCNESMKSDARIRDICLRENALEYVNLPGGRELYDPSKFASAGINLSFVEASLPCYPQFSSDFHPGLSIIDVLMHNDPATVKEMLR